MFEKRNQMNFLIISVFDPKEKKKTQKANKKRTRINPPTDLRSCYAVPVFTTR
jgi:hypothetical protein